MPRVIPPSEFRDADTVAVARRLLGRILACRQPDGSVVRRRIVEVEAYHGHEDRASHASRGLTPRNRPMFSAGGLWYVYLCYGVHEMLNLVTGPEGFPAAILLRGVEGAVGPGRLTRALGIDRRFNALPVSKASGLWVEEDDVSISSARIVATPRIGIDYAGAEWASKPWRFLIADATASRRPVPAGPRPRKSTRGPRPS